MVIVGAVGFLGVHLFGVEAVLAQNSQINADDTLDAVSYGDSIDFGWVELPEGTMKLVLARTSNQDSPWSRS